MNFPLRKSRAATVRVTNLTNASRRPIVVYWWNQPLDGLPRPVQ